jgi:hypothetical protein
MYIINVYYYASGLLNAEDSYDLFIPCQVYHDDNKLISFMLLIYYILINIVLFICFSIIFIMLCPILIYIYVCYILTEDIYELFNDWYYKNVNEQPQPQQQQQVVTTQIEPPQPQQQVVTTHIEIVVQTNPESSLGD